MVLLELASCFKCTRIPVNKYQVFNNYDNICNVTIDTGDARLPGVYRSVVDGVCEIARNIYLKAMVILVHSTEDFEIN